MSKHKLVKPTSAKPEWGSVEDVAALYDMSTRTVRRLIANGTLPAYRIGPRKVMVNMADALALAERIPTAGDAA